MQQATQYFGLFNKNGAWILSDHARRNLQHHHCLLCAAHNTLHLAGCFGARLSVCANDDFQALLVQNNFL
eukprot:11427817-Prorocentrum_lima.AAC.1